MMQYNNNTKTCEIRLLSLVICGRHPEFIRVKQLNWKPAIAQAVSDKEGTTLAEYNLVP